MSEWATQAQAVVEVSFESTLAEMHKDSVGWLYYYLGEHPVAEAVTNLSPAAEDGELSEWVQLVVGLYAHDVAVAMIAPVEYSNQSAEPHPVAHLEFPHQFPRILEAPSEGEHQLEKHRGACFAQSAAVPASTFLDGYAPLPAASYLPPLSCAAIVA